MSLGNQYADKIFAEHPIATWPLDEDVYFLSLITDNDRSFSTWSRTNCTYSDTPTLPDTPSPFDSEIYSSLTANTSSSVEITAISGELFGATEVSSDVSTFCFNFFLYHKPTYINWFKVGYQYIDAGSVTHTVLSNEIPPAQIESWINFNYTYSLPPSWSGKIRLVIKVNFANSSGGDASSRTVIMNGLSIGQESESTCYSSLGDTKQTLPQELGLTSMYGIPADQYGVLSENGYYLIRNNKLLSRNDGFPIIYGTDHSTKIFSSGVGLPSLIFPGKGMLHESGRNKQYTFEMWMQLDPETSTAKRIVGPLDSDDGLWVKEGFLTLVLGNQISSHFVGEWYRPMLVHIIIKQNNVLVFLNGETIINVPLNRSTINLSSGRDWWGIYSYPSFNMFKVDCISIFPYNVSNLVAKRRFVYGQGSPSIESIDNSFSGTPVSIDFSTSENNANIIYPDIARWDAGYFNNLTATKDYISLPNYQLPIINLSGRDVDQWYEDNYIVNTLDYPEKDHPNFITFRPNIVYDNSGNPVSWDSDGINYVDQSYLNFQSLNILNDPTVAVYGIFEIEKNISDLRTLMSFSNVISGETFDITIEGDTVKYSINDTLLYSEQITIGIENLIGINFENLGIAYGYEVSRFFSSPSSIQLYVGGNGNNTFEGKIYLIGFCNQTNYEQISANFNSNGITLKNNYEILLDHFASYTLIPEYEYNRLFLDISVQSFWEEYFPLTFFGSYIKDNSGNPLYDLDMMQVNIGYPTVQSFIIWTYLELNQEFNGQTYQDLEDSVYNNYFNLNKRNTLGGTINISSSSMKSYITFQSLADGANAPLSSFPYIKQLNFDSVIDADAENTLSIPDKAYQTKFLFKDNVVVYPPKSKNFEDYAMTVHFEINQRSITKNPLKIKSFEITSKNLNYPSDTQDASQANYIGTKYGTKIYPQIDIFGKIDYKNKNPYFIYKSNTPYIYTTKKSGIKVVNKTQTEDVVDQCKISIPVNKNGSFDFNVAAMRFFILSDIGDEIGQIPVAEIKHKNGTIQFVLNKAENTSTIKAYNRPENAFITGGEADTTSFTDFWDGEDSVSQASLFINIEIGSLPLPNSNTSYTEIKDITFYQNGKYVVSPSIQDNEWNDIGISFQSQLDFSEYRNGEINLFGGFTFNNISFYLSEGLGVKTDLTIRVWDEVLNKLKNGSPAIPPNIWSYWSDETWSYVYVLGQTSAYALTPENIYSTYTGTNKDIVDDGMGLQLQQSQSIMLTDVSWSSYSKKPA